MGGNEQSDPGESGQDLLTCRMWRTARVESRPESPEERGCLWWSGKGWQEKVLSFWVLISALDSQGDSRMGRAERSAEPLHGGPLHSEGL